MVPKLLLVDLSLRLVNHEPSDEMSFWNGLYGTLELSCLMEIGFWIRVVYRILLSEVKPVRLDDDTEIKN